MKRRVAITVKTPNGIKHHGMVDTKDAVFLRDVDWNKDRMVMFNAWSIHPEALDTIKRMNVGQLVYRCDGRIYRIDMKDVDAHGFKKEFSGGETVYIPLQYWEIDGNKPMTLPPAFEKKPEKVKEKNPNTLF